MKTINFLFATCFFLFICTVVYANQPVVVKGRNAEGQWEYIQVKNGAIQTYLDGTGVNIDSASITLDTAGLAGYRQIDDLQKYLSIVLSDTRVFMIDTTVLTQIKIIGDTALLKSDTIILFLNDLKDTLSLIYLSSIAADSSTYIRDGIPGNADAITESVIEKINPFTKEIIARYEYEYIYNANGKLISKVLK